jgi:hypothetical protein
MSGPATQFRDAIREVLGLTKSTSANYLTGAIQTTVSTQPIELYSILLAASATVAVDLRFDDVSATGLGTGSKLTLHTVPVGIWGLTFDRPIGFDKGFVINYSASGAANIDCNIVYSPRPDPFARALF